MMWQSGDVTALGAFASPATLALSYFAGDAFWPFVSRGSAEVTAAISDDPRLTSTSFGGATDAADMWMNSRYPPIVRHETPASAIALEASLWIAAAMGGFDADSCSRRARSSRWS
jgi:hypothetical protein